MKWNKQTMKGSFTRRARGQGMVEFALSLPLLLLVLAGLMEIANLVLLYSRMETVTREASRFGALGGTDTGVREVFYQGARDSLETQPGVLEMWVVRPVLQYNAGTQTYSWKGATSSDSWGLEADNTVIKAVCVYPESGCENADSGMKPQDILNQIKNSGATRGTANGDRFVIVGTYYEARTILNLPFYKVPGGETGRVPLRTVAVYRQEVAQETVNMLANGCSVFPIMVNINAASYVEEGKAEVYKYMNPGATATDIAREGTIFKLNRDSDLARTDPTVNPNGTEFDFLAWQYAHQNLSSLDASMIFPGNSMDTMNGYKHPYDEAANFANPDRMLNLGDPILAQPKSVWASPGVVNDERYITADRGGFRRSIRIILSNGKAEAAGDFHTYEVMGFAIVHINSYSIANNELVLEFVRFDKSCGEAKK